jgi:hypothetical protein
VRGAPRDLFLAFTASWALLGRPLLASEEVALGAPRAIPLAAAPLSIAAGRFSPGGRPGIAAVHGTSKVSVLVQAPGTAAGWKELPQLHVGNGPWHIRAADFDGDGLDDLSVADPGSTAYTVRCAGDAFEPPAALDQALGPRATVIEDFDGDGMLDIAAANHPESSVAVFLGKGDGSFLHLETITAGSFGHNHDISALDQDGDGWMDLVIAVDFQGLQILRGAGDGSFQASSISGDLVSSALFVAGARLDGDGLGDVVAIWNESGMFMAVAGTSAGDGTFKKGGVFPGVSCLPGCSDMDGDGITDLTCTILGKGTIEIHRGKGDGTYLDPLVFDCGLTNCLQVLPADMDLDGYPDLLIPPGDSACLLLVSVKEGGDPVLPAGPFDLDRMKTMAIADMDRDGFPDILAGASQPRIDVSLGPGKKSPPAWTPSFSILTSGLFSSLQAVDVDADGSLDLAGKGDGGQSILVAFLESSGRVRREAALPAGGLSGPLAVGPIDGDGILDLAVPRIGSADIAVFRGTGGGEFAAPSTSPTISKPREMILADLDRDGLTDIAVLSSSTLAVHWGDGSGGLGPPGILLESVNPTLLGLSIGDLDADGIPDILAADPLIPAVVVLRGENGRSFHSPQVQTVREARTSMILADLDGNGLPDLIGASPGSSSASIFPNPGDRGWTDEACFWIGLRPTCIGVADMDLDGALDLVAGNASAGTIVFGRMLPGGGFRRGDADGSGNLDLSDAIFTLRSLFMGGAAPGCEDAADADDSGGLDLTDAIFSLEFQFLGGPPPPAPGPETCGPDPTPGDGLGECADPKCR